MENKIEFYSPKSPYYEFSNFYTKKPIDIDNYLWLNVEHYFQAQKFIDYPEYYAIIQSCDSGRAERKRSPEI